MPSHDPWSLFALPGLPWAHFTCADEHAFDRYSMLSAPCAIHSSVRIVRGHRCQTKPQLLQEWAAALQFPAYFGHNWDAFDECITDLWWLPPTRYLFIVTRSDLLLTQEARDLTIFFEILHRAAQSWATWRPTEIDHPRITPFHVLFQYAPGMEANGRYRLLQTSPHLVGMWGDDFTPITWPYT